MPGKALHTIGKLLVIWGVLLPAIAFLWFHHYDPQRGVIEGLRTMSRVVAGTRVGFNEVLSGGLVMVGVGLSLMAGRRGKHLPPP